MAKGIVYRIKKGRKMKKCYTVTIVTVRIFGKESSPEIFSVVTQKTTFRNWINRRFDNYADAVKFQKKIITLSKRFKKLFDNVTNRSDDFNIDIILKRLGKSPFNTKCRFAKRTPICILLFKYS